MIHQISAQEATRKTGSKRAPQSPTVRRTVRPPEARSDPEVLDVHRDGRKRVQVRTSTSSPPIPGLQFFLQPFQGHLRCRFQNANLATHELHRHRNSRHGETPLAAPEVERRRRKGKDFGEPPDGSNSSSRDVKFVERK